MTTTAFIWRYLRSALHETAALLICACLVCMLPTQTRAASGDSVAAEISQLQIDRSVDGIYLTASVRFDLPSAVEDALLKGIPMFFVAEVEVSRDRWYWYAKKIFSAERHMRLVYQPLTRRWRLNIASGAITANSLGIALNQSFDSLSDALAAVRRVSRWKIAESADIDPALKHNLEFNFRLDLSQLPRPFQIGVLGQADWNISATASQRLSPESMK